jgi:hypothetical protein
MILGGVVGPLDRYNLKPLVYCFAKWVLPMHVLTFQLVAACHIEVLRELGKGVFIVAR